MKKGFQIGILALVAVALLASCRKVEKYEQSPIKGHWGCEKYISHRVDTANGIDRWDTLYYEVGTGRGYEVYFYADGTGKLLLNDSPALIKKFKCDYDYDSDNQILTIYNTNWITSMFSDATSADMDIEELTDTTIRSSWINEFSEPIPFFERFFMKRID
ncbi:MAG: hypothetical protein IJ622_12645 [Bacteroidales bacterium]|nr:hypothetical protein [Bacteroidales bacterium]